MKATQSFHNRDEWQGGHSAGGELEVKATPAHNPCLFPCKEEAAASLHWEMLVHLTQFLRCLQGTLICRNGKILTPHQNPAVTKIHPRLMWNNQEQEAALPRAEPLWVVGAGAG